MYDSNDTVSLPDSAVLFSLFFFLNNLFSPV